MIHFIVAGVLWAVVALICGFLFGQFIKHNDRWP